uniref:Uncharacterized protein n=1 Tax=Arundo donax TaxID=35708 RepID=A0A0A9H1T1_ARUDO
MLYLIMRGLF